MVIFSEGDDTRLYTQASVSSLVVYILHAQFALSRSFWAVYLATASARRP
jgi:hypothetical protein